MDLRSTHDQLHYLGLECGLKMREEPSGELTKDLQVLYGLLVNRFILAQSRQQVFLKPGKTWFVAK
jgi:hypothetical protein